MTLSFTAEARDSLSNLAASLNAGRDKAAGDAFFLFDLDRSQVETMYRGDWLARKIVDIVPYDMVREWRAWSGDRGDVAAAEAAERRFKLRKLVQRALTLGRLYGGAAIIIGAGEEDPADLARELVPEGIRPDGIKFLHVVSRWQLSTPTVNRDPLSPWFGEPDYYEITAPTRGALRLHPSRVIRFLGNELPDPSLGLSAWSDSVLQTLYDAVHSVVLTTTGATSLMHEAKVDVVTVPNLSEHLSSAATTAQLSARFSYAAAMKSLNNLLLLGDGETWSRQKIDFAGLPEMVRTFLQVAAGAADIPVTRLLGQSPAGMSATGESDTRNYYDMVSARQELDLRPQLERLDNLILRSAGVDPASLTFEFRPLWQMDAAASATVALQKAQASQIYAGLNLWTAATTARLVQSQLIEDGTYPGAEAIFAEAPPPAPHPTTDFNFDPNQPRDPDGRWTSGEGGNVGSTPAAAPKTGAGGTAPAQNPPAPSSETTAPQENAPFGHAPDGTPVEAASTAGPGMSASPAAPDPVAEAIVRLAAVTLAPLLVAASLRQRALEVMRGLVQNLSNWLPTGSPPDPPPSADPSGSGARASVPSVEPFPRPLTIHGGLPQLAPPGESYSLSGQAGDPEESNSPGKALAAIDVPSGLTVEVNGGTNISPEKQYEDGVRNGLDFEPAPPTNKQGGQWPDGLRADPDTNDKIALEVKYLGQTSPKLRDPNRDVPFINKKDVDQLRKYIEKFKGGLLLVVNDERLVGKYDELLRGEDLSGYRIVFIPSLQE